MVMISVLRVRFNTNGDLGSVWSDDVTTAWMQRLTPWSLGNYWMTASHGLLPLDSVVWPAVVMSDPRTPGADNKTNRTALTQGAADAGTAQAHVDWDETDVLILVFAQPTDLFGNGSATVPLSRGGSKTIPVTVVDIASTFIDCCQELGHSLGFQHELDADGREYASPYSCMSSRTNAAEFVRPAVAGLPVGTTITNPKDAMIGQDPQRVAGVLLTGAQLWNVPGFRGSPLVIELTRDYATNPARVRIHPPDWISNQPPGPRPVLVAVPSNRGDGRMFFVEFRRAGTGYEQGLGSSSSGLAVHSLNPDGRIRYEGAAVLDLATQQTDWGCVAGDFALRYRAVDPGQNPDWVEIEIRGGSELQFPIRGVLLLGGFRTQRQLNTMSHDDMRNTLIVELTGRTNQSDYQAFDNDTLAGAGATLVFLRNAGLRSDAELRTMTADDIRNTTIVELDQQTGMGRSLQALTSLELAQVVLGSDRAVRGVDLTAVSHWTRGVLLVGRFRGQRDLNRMSFDDMRNTLIVELTGRTNQTDYQSYDDHRLAGAGAVLVAMRHMGIRTDAQLRTMSADDMRNTLIVELDAQTHTGRALQGLDDLALAKVALGVEAAS